VFDGCFNNCEQFQNSILRFYFVIGSRNSRLALIHTRKIIDLFRWIGVDLKVDSNDDVRKVQSRTDGGIRANDEKRREACENHWDKVRSLRLHKA
jgi:hypothetical protein